MSNSTFINTLRALLGNDLEKVMATRLSRMDELDALIALHREFGEAAVRRVISNALTTYLDRAGRRRHYDKVSAIEVLETYRRLDAV
jgi:hypothetical protein